MSRKIPITFCLMTTTKGHFGVKTRWRETLNSFGTALPFSEYEACAAHIKVSGDDEYSPMAEELSSRGFGVYVSHGEWSHGQESHQLNYLADMTTILSSVRTPYVFVCEDDWLLDVSHGEFIDWVHEAILHFDEDPDIMQIRIPRYFNERARIDGLKAKHGLDRQTGHPNGRSFSHDDFSANPSFYRTRDIRAAVTLTMRTNLPKHMEHGVGQALKLLSWARLPFACFDPDKIRIGHIGTKPGEEDDLSKPLIAT